MEPADEIDEGLAALDAAVSGLAGIDPALVSRSGLAAVARRLEVARTRLEAAALRVLGEVDRQAVWADHGAANGASWLTAETGQARAVAGSRVRLAQRLRLMPATRVALAAGEVTESHAGVLSRGLGPRTGARFAQDEELLVGYARRHTADEMERLLAYWLAHADPDGPEPRDGRADTVQLSKTLDRWLLKGSFGLEHGAELAAALAEKVDELWRRDQAQAEVDPGDPGLRRSAAERRAAALAELVSRGAAAPASTARRRPALIALVDWRTLHDHTDGQAHGGSNGSAGAIGGRGESGDGERRSGPGNGPESTVHELDDGTVLAPSLIELWACDCEITRVVLGPAGEIVDLGRSARTASAAQRRALVARDRRCVVPGCDRPPGWCDAHHITWWEHGGSTDIDNLALLCRHHHRRIHARHLRIHMHDGRPVITRADGTPLHHPRRPPPQPPPSPPSPPDPPHAPHPADPPSSEGGRPGGQPVAA